MSQAIPFPFIDDPDLLVITGSRLYGCARFNDAGECISDTDLRGFVVPPHEYLLNFANFEEGEREGDHKIWGLKHFLTYLVKGNAQCLECIFSPPSHILRATEVGKYILDNRDLFLSKIFYKSITGFSYSEWHKVKGVKEVPVKRTLSENEVLDMFRDKFKHLPKDKWDAILEIAYSEHPRVVVDAKADVGEKRRKEYGIFGYSPTCAHHALRLLFQCEEFLQSGFMTFPLPEAPMLSAVKRGELSIEEIDHIHADISARVDAAYVKSTLPERVDTKKVWRLYEDLIEDRMRSHYATEIVGAVLV